MESTNTFYEGPSGFMKNRQTSDAFQLRDVIEKKCSKSKMVYTASVDYKIFFDTILRKLLLRKLNKIGIALSAINVINFMHSAIEVKLRLE